MHKRLLPKVNAFTYGIYYLCCPLKDIQTLADGFRFGLNRFGLLGFYAKDHGTRAGSDGAALEKWAQDLLQAYGVAGADGDIVLVCMPRVLGYVFNPVSFWLCYDKAGNLRAVICEVNNTFGESHSYVCAHEDGRVLQADDWLTGKKVFHVSPFLPREGGYRFRFAIKPDKFGIWIDHDNAEGSPKLLTALSGRLEPATRAAWRRAFWGYPLVTLKAIFLIHWQALKLLFKGMRYIPKPVQNKEKISSTDNLTKK